MYIRQLFDQETGTYTYVLIAQETKEAVIIDPVLEQVERDVRLIEELGVQLRYILETHIHADHITGSASLKEHFPEAKTVVSKYGGATCPDILVDDGDGLHVGPYEIRVLSTPGHTDGCVSYLVDGKVFTGDALLIRGCGRTDFQQGSPEKLYDSVYDKLFTLSDKTEVYPAHNYIGLDKSTIGEEKKYNVRLAHTTKEEFVQKMKALELPYPKKIRESVPANLACGKQVAV